MRCARKGNEPRGNSVFGIIVFGEEDIFKFKIEGNI
jgi:hypothetical protein